MWIWLVCWKGQRCSHLFNDVFWKISLKPWWFPCIFHSVSFHHLMMLSTTIFWCLGEPIPDVFLAYFISLFLSSFYNAFNTHFWMFSGPKIKCFPCTWLSFSPFSCDDAFHSHFLMFWASKINQVVTEWVIEGFGIDPETSNNLQRRPNQHIFR